MTEIRMKSELIRLSSLKMLKAAYKFHISLSKLFQVS